MEKDRSQFTSPPGPAEPEVKGGISVLRCGSEQPVFNMQEALGSALNNTPTPQRKEKESYSRKQMQGWPWGGLLAYPRADWAGRAGYPFWSNFAVSAEPARLPHRKSASLL